MRRKIASGIMLTLLLVAMLYTALNVRLVAAWSNGGFSDDPANPNYGTHDWIAEHALDWLPTKEKQYILGNLAAYLYGTELPDNAIAPDGIGDTVKHHIYYWADGNLQDDLSAVRASEEYHNTLNFLKLGDLVNASKNAGIMSHYIVDVALFGHVMGAGTDWGAETHHSDYESYVNERTNSYDDEFNVYLSFDGELRSVSAYDAAKELAYDTTFDVDGNLTCVWMDQNYNWNDPTFRNRCGESLNLAVNYLTDVLHTLVVELPVKLYVNPPLVEYWTPAYGTAFSVDVKIANVTNLYGFEFKLYWNTSLLDLIGVKVTAPSVWGTNYFVGMNETREDLGRCWLAVTALNPAPSFSGSAKLVTLTFKITHDPIYPKNVTSTLNLNDSKLSDPDAQLMPHVAYDGEYWCYSTKPRLKVMPPEFRVKKRGTTPLIINVTISSVVNLYSFKFKLSYNTTILDATNIEIGPFIKKPYHVDKLIIDDATGVIWLEVTSTSPAPPANGSGILARITFEYFTVVWPDPPLQCILHLYDTLLKTNLNVEVQHDTVDGFFIYEPIPGDLNSDGSVNVLDLRMVARAFGSKPGDPNWDLRADLNRDGEVDICDLVKVARNYGRTS